MEANCSEPTRSPKRIMIFGIPGSGKSTFALNLSYLLHLPLFHLDKYFFVNDWQERNYEDFLNIQKELVEQEAWVIDGNATRSLEMRFSKADIVLYFRFNRCLCLWRIFKRLLNKNPHISDRAEGCTENVSLHLIRYLWGFPKRVNRSIEEFRQKYPEAQFHEFQNDKQTNAFLNSLKKRQKNHDPQQNVSFRFSPAIVSQKDLLHQWFEQKHIKEWMHGVGLQNTLNGLEKFFQGRTDTIYWIGYDKDYPFAFLITSPVGKDAITLDLFICDLNYLGKGLATPMIKEFLISQFSHVKKVLIDPEATNIRAIHVYQKVGFRIIGEFIASWHPVLHYQMELYMKDLETGA